MLSLVMPLYNEMQHNYIQKSLPQYKKQNLELILIDGGSSDGTCDYVKSLDLKYYLLENSSRLSRIKKGLELCRGDKIIIHHPRSILDKNAFKHLSSENADWGAFTHQFDESHPLLKFTSFYSNYIRGDIRGIFYLDHCFYLQRKLINSILEIPDCDIFEDTFISLELKKYSSPKRLSSRSTTSSVRFKKNGIYKQAFLNQKMKWFYYLNKDFDKMNKEYEKDLKLNNETEK